LNNTTGAPVVTVTDTTNFTDGIYEFWFNYLPIISRNDPTTYITNKVDVYVDGSRLIEATENVSFSNATTFNNTDGTTVAASSTSMNRILFQRLDGTYPENGNIFIPLHYSPILEMATGNQNTGSVINISSGNMVYTENGDYWVVNEIDQFGNSSRSRAGLEWKASGRSPHTNPSNGNVLSVDYIYNQIPQSIQQNIDLWRLVTTDVMIHSAVMLYLDTYLAVVLSNGGFTISGVFNAIQTAISNYLTNISFDGVVQLSAILSVVQQVPGVAAVRFLTSADSAATLYGIGPLNGVAVGSGAQGHFGIQQINASNRVIGTTTLAQAINSTQTSISVISNIGFPTSGAFTVQIGSEQMQVVAGQGTNTWTVVRGTSPAAATAGSSVFSTGSGVVVQNFAQYDGAVYRATDIFLEDDELVALNNVYLSQMSSGTFGSV
jgi:hypothetical protein